MISFNKLGEYGRLGNQLFQYAFLRSQAKRLGIQFYCPAWVGEKVFLLNDTQEKSDSRTNLYRYDEDSYQHGFSQKAMSIQDGTDVAGYFQSPDFFDKEDIFRWYQFDNELFSDVRKKYESIDFSKAVAVHVRLGDYVQGSLMFYTPTPEYFKDALTILATKGDVLVFSEDVKMAEEYLGEMPKNTLFIEGNKDYEDFYLMTLCKDIVISPSSFSWWAAYLNKHEDKKVVMPKYWYIPYSRVINNSLAVKDWIQIKGHRIIADNYYYRYVVALLCR